MRRKTTVATIAAVCLVQSAHSEPFLSGSATVNGMSVFTVNGNVPGSGAGVTVAGAKVFHPVQTDYRVSATLGNAGPPVVMPTDRMANAQESPKIDDLVAAVSAIPIANDATAKKQFEASARTAFSKIMPDNAANPPVFPEIKKFLFLNKPTLAATTKTVSNPPSEAAQSSASQTAAVNVFGGTNITSTETPTSSAKGQGAAAAAVAINRDPLAVIWTTPVVSLSLSDFTTNPSSPTTLSLTAQAPVGGGAVALYDMNVSSLQFASFGQIPTDIPGQDALEATAPTLFDFTALLVTDGTNTAADFALDLGSAASVLDNFGDTTASALVSRLDTCATTPDPACPLSITDGVLSFTKNFSFSVTLPDSPNSSLLFERESSIAVAEVPEPRSLVILCIGLLGIATVRLVRRHPLSAAKEKQAL